MAYLNAKLSVRHSILPSCGPLLAFIFHAKLGVTCRMEKNGLKLLKVFRNTHFFYLVSQSYTCGVRSRNDFNEVFVFFF